MEKSQKDNLETGSVEERSYWILKSNKEYQNLKSVLIEKGPITFVINRHYLESTGKPIIKKDDIVYFWQAGEQKIYGWGIVIRGPERKNEGERNHLVNIECSVKFKKPIAKKLILDQYPYIEKKGSAFGRGQGTSFIVDRGESGCLNDIICVFR